MRPATKALSPRDQYEADKRSLQATLGRMRRSEPELVAPKKSPQPVTVPRRGMGKVGLRIDLDELDLLRNAVATIDARGGRVTLEGIIRGAIRLARYHLELTYNDGMPFPVRTEALRSGRKPRRTA